MSRTTVVRTIDAPIEKVFDTVAHIENFSRAIPHIVDTEFLSDVKSGVGTYFAFRVGLPGKSGVGGGIVAVMPGKFSACVWAPGLDERGNSLVGIKALERLTSKTGLSVC